MRVAIVGCGQISRAHVNALRQMEDVQIVAVCDQDKHRAQDLATLAGNTAVYTDLAALLEQAKPDVAHILTPPSSHAKLAIQAMDAGVHALVEKPMTVSVEEADRMIEAARRNNVKLGTNHNYLFKPSVVKARELVDSGAIGDVVYVNSYYGLAGEGGSFGGGSGAHWAWRLPGGVFTNFLPHLIYLQMAFLKNIEGVAGVTLRGKTGEPSSEMTVLLNGAEASGVMEVTTRSKPYAKFVQIYGTKGMIEADLVREVCTIHREQRLPRMLSKALYSLEESIQLTRGTIANTAKVVTGKMKNMPELPAIFAEFYASIRENRDTIVSGENGRRMMRIMEQAWAKAPAVTTPDAIAKPIEPQEPKTAAERAVVERGGMPGKVLVTGANGFLGRHLVAALARTGADVVAVVRDKSRVSFEMERQAKVVAADLRDPASLRAIMDGVSVVYHCAAVTANNLPWATHYQTNVLGSQAIFDAALETGVKRVIHVSSVIVYGLDDARYNGTLIDENTPYARNGDRYAHYLRSKIEADKLALAYQREKQLPVTVVRLGILYGPGGGRSVGRGLVQLGPLRMSIGNGRNLLPYTHVSNAVDCMLLAAVTPEAEGQAYNVVDDVRDTVRDLALRGAELTGERLIMVPVPPVLLNSVAGILEIRNGMKGSESAPKLSRYVIRSAVRNIQYATDKAKQQLGWQPAVTLDAGLRQALDN